MLEKTQVVYFYYISFTFFKYISEVGKETRPVKLAYVIWTFYEGLIQMLQVKIIF